MKIFRISNVLILVLATGLGGSLFWTSQKVQIKQNALAELDAQSQHERETLSVLTVEWDYLNRPQRLEQLTQEYLHVARPKEDKIVVNAAVIAEPVTPPLEEVTAAIIPAVASPAQIVAAVAPDVTPKPVQVPVPAAPVIEKNDSEQFQSLLENLSGGQ